VWTEIKGKVGGIMAHIPYGYKIVNGKAEVDEKQAEAVRKLFDGYIAGLGLKPAAENAEREGLKQRIAEMQQFLAEQRGTIQVYDEQVVRKLIEKITVHDEKVTVAFKSGMEIDVKI
jgi:hypothetical protein